MIDPTEFLIFNEAVSSFNLCTMVLDAGSKSEATPKVAPEDEGLYYYEIEGLPCIPLAAESTKNFHVASRVYFSSDPIQVKIF